MDEETSRLVNLAEVLAEQYPDAPELPSDALYWWDEDDVRAYFCSSGAEKKSHDPKAFQRWFPGLTRSGTKVDGKPKMRILCFPNAGNTEDMYTHEGTGVRRAQSPLLELAKSNECEVLAVQYAGRANRKNEGYAFDIRADIVQELLPVVAGKLDEVPYHRGAQRRHVGRVRVPAALAITRRPNARAVLLLCVSFSGYPAPLSSLGNQRDVER